MRATSFLLSLLVFLAIASAYFAGHYMGEAEGREASGDARFHLDALRIAEAFVFVGSIRQALRESKPAQAELAAVRHAARKVPSPPNRR